MNKDSQNKKNIKSDPPLTAREEVSEFAKTALFAIVLAVLIRSFFYEPFNIPSGSMQPTLDIGDYLFVHKPAYGYSRHSFPFSVVPINGRALPKEPKRGDVAVFKLPTNTSVDYIKRVIGMPGETVQVKAGRLYINDIIVPRRQDGITDMDDGMGGIEKLITYTETLPDGAMHKIYEDSDDGPLDNTPLYTVPDGHYFMMGDNRDNSQDSRVMQGVGFVPFENFVGRADFLFFSTKGTAALYEFWKWPKTIRYDRLFKSINPERINAQITAQTELDTDIPNVLSE